MRQNSLSLGDASVDVGGEEEVTATGGFDDVIEAGLIDGKVVRVPCVNTGLVEVDDGDLDVGAEASLTRLRGRVFRTR
jgi:hypothetical protein